MSTLLERPLGIKTIEGVWVEKRPFHESIAAISIERILL